MRPLAAAALLVLVAAVGAAQTGNATVATNEATKAEEAAAWEFNASVFGYFPPEDTDYGQPTVMADRGALHLETRYNYEGIDTGSAWVGWNVGVGDELRLDATLMAGGVFGKTKGVAPGYELTITWGPFELYSEGEYVVDVEDSDNNFLYNWAQLAYSPLDWLSVGLVSQRTRAYQTGLDVQRGFLVGVQRENLSFTVYVFNPGWETPTVVTSVSVSF
jgi:hypothetical protein